MRKMDESKLLLAVVAFAAVIIFVSLILGMLQ